jgi:hypothetical protein
VKKSRRLMGRSVVVDGSHLAIDNVIPAATS